MYALQKDRYYRFPMINLKIQMQEQENLARQLQKLQEECVNDYLQSRLQTITSKEVIREIIQGFIAVNNEQFFQSISETIQTVKQNNKYLAEQMETLKKQHTFEVDELSKKLYESEQLQQKIKIELNGELNEKSNQLRIMVQQKQSEKQTLLKISQHQKVANLQLQKQLLQKEQLVVLLQQKLNKTNKENNLLTLQVEKTKESSMKFKESCEKILKEANKQREKQKEKLVESWNNQKQINQQQIQQLKNEIRTKQMLWEEKSCLEEQSKQQLVQNLKAEIIEINQQLNLSRQQILTRVAQSQQLADRMNQMSKNLQKLQKQNQTSHVSNLYLQEESNYLRNQIIQFDTRYKQLEEEKIQLEHNFNYFKASKNAELGSTEKALEQLSLEHKQTVQKITEQTSTTLQNITAELQFLKQRELIYRQNESTLITRQQQIQNLLIDCQQENKCMTEQLQLHCADNEVHQKQIKLYQESIIKLNQDFRAQMEAQKQFFETNWKETNEELLQEKYRCLKLRQQLEKAKEEISLFHQKQQIYVLYHQEIAQLKSQLALISSYQAQKNTFKGQFKSKTYFLLSRASQEVKKLKKQNRSLRQSVIKLIKQHREQIEQMFTVTVLKIRQQSLKCLFCEHQKTLKNNQKTAIQQLMLKKTMPRLGNNQSMNYSHIKKALKTVNQRYQTLNQENKHYTDHIEGVIGKI